MLQPEGSMDSQRQQYSPVFVCATHWGSLHRKELLFGISLPREFKSSQYFYSMEYTLSQEEDIRVLNPYQDVYLLLDNGLSEANDSHCPLQFRRKFEQFIKETAAKEMRGSEDLNQNSLEVTLPVVTLVIGGDDQTLNQVLDSVNSSNPVIVVNKSGAIPSLLSELFYNLEATHPSLLDPLTDPETSTFDFCLNRNDNYLRRFLNSLPGTNVQETVRQIMEKRYYVTVVESSFENEETLHCSIIQGIYKGYSRRNAMVIALETGTYDFIQALFLRDVDPQFTKEHYITVQTLNHFYQENLCSERSISKVLKFMCKPGFTIEVNPKVSILPVVGRIFHLLLGPRYKVMYQEDKYSEVTAYENFEKKEDQLWHLFLWSVLSAKPDVTQFFLMQTSSPLGASLLAFKLYSKLASYSHKIYEEDLAITLRSAADHFQGVAIQILSNMCKTDPKVACRVLISELPFGLGPYVTPLLIADDSDAEDFMSHSCCQAYLQKVWKGNMAVGTPAWKSLPFLPLFVFILPIHFDGSPLKQLNVESKKAKQKTHIATVDDSKTDMARKVARELYSKGKSYYTAPINKFHTRMFAYMAFLGLLSYYVLTDLKPFTLVTEITVCEWIVIAWELMLIVEELVQLATISVVAPTYGVEKIKLNNAIWHHYEKLRMNQFFTKLQLYIHSGRWNSVDLAMVILFIVSFALRFALPLETFQMARIFFAVTVIVCYFRLLRFWSVLGKLGQRIIAIEMMLTELVKFIIVLALFVVSFGVAFQAILNPNQTPSWSTFADILYRPYWEMFGELFLMEDPGMGRPVGSLSCQVLASEESMYVNGTHGIICYEWAVPILLGIYLLISSVLLLNLLVAIFSMAYEEVNAMSRKISRFNHYSLTHESFYNEWLPPPLSIPTHLYRCIRSIVKRRKPEKPQEEDCFRLKHLSSSDELLQKKACEGIKMYSKDDKDGNMPKTETLNVDRDDLIEALKDRRVIEALKTYNTRTG